MLAQNFMTPTALKISDAEFEALVKVLGMLERGDLIQHGAWVSNEDGWGFRPTIPNGFNMSCSGERTHCGTVACIGGWVAILTGRGHEFVNGMPGDHPLYKLCWSNTDSTTTTEQAAIALRSYLTTGDPCWADALA